MSSSDGGSLTSLRSNGSPLTAYESVVPIFPIRWQCGAHEEFAAPDFPFLLLGGSPSKISTFHLETAPKLLKLLERVWAVFSKRALKSLDNSN
jgi:hypothetical protein